MSRVTVVAALAGFLLMSSSAFAAGKDVFTAQKCTMCHSVSAQKIAGGKKMDLSKVGAQHDASWFKGWLQKKETVKGAKHMAPWKGTDAELTEVANWLSTLK